jgi:hypothetical protein
MNPLPLRIRATLPINVIAKDVRRIAGQPMAIVPGRLPFLLSAF